MPRKPIGAIAMSSTERSRKHRASKQPNKPKADDLSEQMTELYYQLDDLGREIQQARKERDAYQSAMILAQLELKIAKDELKEVRARHRKKAGGGNHLPAPLIKRLVQFCHPDRHGNSQIAQELTAELLKLR